MPVSKGQACFMFLFLMLHEEKPVGEVGAGHQFLKTSSLQIDRGVGDGEWVGYASLRGPGLF